MIQLTEAEYEELRTKTINGNNILCKLFGNTVGYALIIFDPFTEHCYSVATNQYMDLTEIFKYVAAYCEETKKKKPKKPKKI